MQLIDRIEGLFEIVADERLSAHLRIAAADEVLMWAGPLLVRHALSHHVGVYAGCVHDADGECRCDEWRALLELRAQSREV